MINWCKYTLLVSLLAICSFTILQAQGDEKKRTRMKLEYLIKSDKSQCLRANLKVREDRYLPLPDASVSFYNVGDTSDILLGEAITDSNGDAILVLNDIGEILKDEDGYMSFRAEFPGDDTIDDADGDVMVKPAGMELSFFKKDSIKYINIDVYELTDDGERFPLEEIPVTIYIKGTFSLLNIGEEYTNEDGNITMRFPVDMPGDTLGIITIVTKVLESDEYGILESQETINWGVPVPIEKVPHRGLGDTDAPLWMVYTLIILLSAVWFDYFYVIYLIYKIKMARRVLTT